MNTKAIIQKQQELIEFMDQWFGNGNTTLNKLFKELSLLQEQGRKPESHYEKSLRLVEELLVFKSKEEREKLIKALSDIEEQGEDIEETVSKEGLPIYDSEESGKELREDKEHLNKISEALALLNAMVVCGEIHSDKSTKVFYEACQAIAYFNHRNKE